MLCHVDRSFRILTSTSIFYCSCQFLSDAIDIFYCHFQVLNFILWYLTSPDFIKASKEGTGSIWHSWCNCWRSSEFYQDCYSIWWPGHWGEEVCLVILHVVHFCWLHLILCKSYVLRSVTASFPRNSSMNCMQKLHKMNSYHIVHICPSVQMIFLQKF
jgi:hypothetical protein